MRLMEASGIHTSRQCKKGAKLPFYILNFNKITVCVYVQMRRTQPNQLTSLRKFLTLGRQQ